jgi:phage I-like protein
LTVTPDGEVVPSEFRIFKAGWNDSEKGPVLFDAEAAKTVMDRYVAHGVDKMIDLEHRSLNQESRAYDPDARGWAKLMLRGDGSLWAVGVTWTDDGVARLTSKRQRYISPFFEYDPETKRVQAVLNIALTAFPATHQTPALMAASEPYAQGGSMTPEQFAAIAEALGLGADANVEDVIAEIGAISKKLQDAAAGQSAEGEPAVAEDPAAEPAAAAAEPPPDPAMQAASVKLCSLTGRESVGEALADVELWRAAYLDLAAERAKIAKSQAMIEADERRQLVAQLVTLGCETPGTAFVDATAKTPRIVARLVAEPIAELRARVATLSVGRAAVTPVKPPKSSGGEQFVKTFNGIGLTQRELDTCAEMKCDPATYAGLKARRDAATKGS